MTHERVSIQTVECLICWGARAALLEAFSRLFPHRIRNYGTFSLWKKSGKCNGNGGSSGNSPEF